MVITTIMGFKFKPKLPIIIITTIMLNFTYLS
jgi:hypothetical protein